MCGMCGVAGRIGGFDSDIVRSMADTMTHRGPDDSGTWTAPDGTVAFGHRRLAIIDLSPGGHQPMHDASGTLTITFNGEIYNYLELRAELEAAGHRFRSQSDTEVMLEAYRRWGTDCVKRFRGQFAFGLYDASARKLFLARDRAGEKPLFYAHGGDRLIFASELKAIMAFPGFDRRVDLTALNQYLAYGYVFDAGCMLQGVAKLPQGHAATYDIESGKLDVWPYWQLPEPVHAKQVTASDDDLVDELHELLRDAVRHQLIADVPVGIMLSGGVDSSLVTAVAAEVSSLPVRTFNISFPGHGTHDESPFARLVANHFGTQHSELAGEAATVDLLPALAHQYDEPMADSSMVPTYLVSRLIRKQATVALGGDGGDELFGGYTYYEWVHRQSLVRRFVPPPLRLAVSKAATALPSGLRGRNYLIGTGRDMDTSLAQANVFFDTATRARLLAPLGISNNGTAERKKARLAHGDSAVQRAMGMDFRSYLVDDILVKVDRASMLTSLEVRAPLLDPKIIEFAYGRVPDHLRVPRGQRKVLLKKLAKRLLPPQLDLERKQGFSIPIDTWFKGDWGAFMRDVLRSADPALFDRRIIDGVIAGQERGLSNAHRIFALTMFELWRRDYKVSI
ncbi:MAG TPA: asparagine synthase (glutamine-hydrolyzing) [Thermoanaerobaculia bacterium]|nr:asparagine synthase (glutamine-hydrolyzing) [Thermoanaerobaculia bacterium]